MGGFWGAIRSSVSFILTTITAFLISPELANKAYQVFAQLWQGFTRVIDPDIVPYLGRASNSRNVLAQSFITNILCYGGLLLFYEAGVRGGVRYGVPAIEDSYPEYGIDLLMRFCLAAYFCVDNIMLNTAIVKASAIDNPGNQRSCDHDTTAKIQGKLASVAYQGTNYVVASAAEYILPVAGIPLRSMLYGRYFVEQGAGGGMCTADRNDIVNRNNAYSFGMGLSFLLVLDVLSYATRSTFGANSAYVNDAVFCFLVQYFLMLSIQHNKSLPGRELGIDVAHPGRMIADKAINHTAAKLVPYFSTAGGTLDWKSLQKELNRYPLLLAQRFLLGTDLSTQASREMFLRRRIPTLLFKLYDETIMNALNRLEQWPSKDLAVNLGLFSVPYNSIIKWTPKEFLQKYVPDYKVNTVKYVSDPQYYNYINQVRAFVAWMRSVQEEKTDLFGAELVRRENELTCVDGTNMLEPASSSAPAIPLPSYTVIEELDAISLAARPSATPSLTGPVSRWPLAVSPAPVSSCLSVPVFDMAIIIKKIAGLTCWNDQGVTWHGSTVPDGIKKIRSASVSLDAIYAEISNKFDANTKRGLPAGMTNDFYMLIKNCYQAKHDSARCKSLLDEFGSKYLKQEERKLVGLSPQQLLSQTGGLRR